MSYTSPTVTSAGLVIPTYIDVRDYLIEQYKSIYGQDAYLEEDSADYQWISAVSLRLHDALSSVQLSYNNRGPQTAIGSGLDQIVKLNGVTRRGASYSNCLVTLAGTAGTVITNGEVVDTSGYRWSLPETVTIGEENTVDVTATCQTIGEITALPDTITSISTPTAGWTSVTNAAAATVGNAVETDSELRTRQRLSVSRPSMNLLAGTISAIAALEEVTRHNVIENPTNTEDIHGTPPHSITCVVEGGDDEDVAEEIWLNRGLGVYTNGDVIIDVTDPITGVITPIRFYRPEYIPIYATVMIYPLDGYTTATSDAIKQAIVDYLNALQIGADVTISALYAAAMAVTEDLYNPSFSILDITIAGIPSPQESIDITILYNQVASGNINNVEVVTA